MSADSDESNPCVERTGDPRHASCGARVAPESPVAHTVVRSEEMITQAKLNEFLWARGDIDGYSRSGRNGDISAEEWFTIDRLLSAITIIRRGLASPGFRLKHDAEVAVTFDSEATYLQLVEFERSMERGD